MARYGIEENLSGTVSPVILNKEFFNFNIQYNGGIFIIMDRNPQLMINIYTRDTFRLWYA